MESGLLPLYLMPSQRHGYIAGAPKKTRSVLASPWLPPQLLGGMVEKQINTTGKPTQADAHEPFHRPGSVPREASDRHSCRNFQSEISQNVESISSSIMMMQIMMYHQIPQGESIVRCIHRSRRYRTVCLVASPFRKVSQFGSRQS